MRVVNSVSLALLAVVMLATPALAEGSLKSKWLELFSSKGDKASTSKGEAANEAAPAGHTSGRHGMCNGRCL